MGSTAEERVSELDSRLLETLQSEQTAQGTEGVGGGQNLRDLKNGNRKSGFRSLGCQKEMIKICSAEILNNSQNSPSFIKKCKDSPSSTHSKQINPKN